MGTEIKFNYINSGDLIHEDELGYMESQVKAAHQLLEARKGPGHDFCGWIDWPKQFDRDEFAAVKEAAKLIQGNSDALVVIGIGGSYLGARAAIEMLSHQFHNLLPKKKRTGPEIYFIGNNMSSTYIANLLELLDGKDISINVISKSGTTTEPAIAFRIFKDLLEKKYGKKGAKDRIYVTTDRDKGALKNLADREGYRTFVVPDDIGGRYSVLTSVGLLPIAASGINIDEMMAGAAEAVDSYNDANLATNPCYQYAALRNILYRKGKTVELLVNYEPNLHYFSEWWKQLFGESEGKDGKGIFPAAVDFTTDLHSMGQYIQEGRRNIFETVISIDRPKVNIDIEADVDNVDGLNFIAGKTVDYVNKQAMRGILLAHSDGGVPNMLVEVPELTPMYFGKLVYFFEKACAISGYLLGVNPFDQPGVEAYKKNMFALLGKPGYEDIREKLVRRLEKLF